MCLLLESGASCSAGTKRRTESDASADANGSRENGWRNNEKHKKTSTDGCCARRAPAHQNKDPAASGHSERVVVDDLVTQSLCHANCPAPRVRNSRDAGQAYRGEHTFEGAPGMPTVQEAAKRYGVTTAFMVQALAQLGHKGDQPEQPISDAALAQFDEKWGEKIRAARPGPSTPTPDEPRTAVSKSRSVRRSAPHVMRIAHARVTAGRDSSGQRVKRLLDSPDVVHAIDAAGTNDGDPWTGEAVSGAVYFYDGSINSGPPAACGWVHMRAVLSD
jgi:hypothetical protein